MSKAIVLTNAQIDYILSPAAIRERATKIFELCQSGKTYFQFHPEKLAPTVDYVLKVIRKNYPSLQIPFHSRWGHFKAGGINRVQQVDGLLKDFDKLEKARTKLDLVITSVLLDAGAGAEWSFYEQATGQRHVRSEGLGVASFYMFMSGVMSADRKMLRADNQGLTSLKTADIEKYFQVNLQNPLVGVEGRLQLLNNLAKAVSNKNFFKDSRPGNILDYLMAKYGDQIPATGVLRAVLDCFGSIWPGRLTAGKTNLGDVWVHSALGGADSFESLVPIHKLSQWMTYSLVEVIEEAGFSVTGSENLTGLAEYRNGGLMLDSGLLTLRDSTNLQRKWTPDSELIIEWRALTVHLLDLIGEQVQKSLDFTPQQFPLAKVLEGGTWWAGRSIAKEKREGGAPPLNIVSDGTVF